MTKTIEHEICKHCGKEIVEARDHIVLTGSMTLVSANNKVNLGLRISPDIEIGNDVHRKCLVPYLMKEMKTLGIDAVASFKIMKKEGVQ